MNKSVTPTRGKYTILKQLCEHIPAYLVSKLAREHGVKSLSFTPWSQVVAMIHAHLTHAMGLNGNSLADCGRDHEELIAGTLPGS